MKIKQSRNLGVRQCSAAQVRRAGGENPSTISGDLGGKSRESKGFLLSNRV